MKQLETFVSAVLAGVCIAIGGTVFLSCENRVVGAVFFAVGLMTIVTRGLNLYTGKAGYAVGQPPAYLGFLALVWLGNFAGTGITAVMLRATRFAPNAKAAGALWQVKAQDGLLSLFILAVFCGLLMFVAVDAYRTLTNDAARVLMVVFCVVVFILCGFEHCVADMFYGWLAMCWNVDTLLRLVLISVGNLLGGILLPCCSLIKPRESSVPR